MIVTHVSIRNFLGITELNLTDCQQRMLVLGKNWSGKTSVLDAIRAVFLGEVRDASSKNLEVADWINKSAKQAAVTIGFTEAGEKFEARLRVQGKGTALEISREGKPTISGSPKEVRNALWAILQANPAHRAAGLNPRLYLSGGDIGQMISDLDRPTTVFRFRAPVALTIKSPAIYCGEIVSPSGCPVTIEAWKNGQYGGSITLEHGPNKFDKAMPLAAMDLIELRISVRGSGDAATRVQDLWITFTT